MTAKKPETKMLATADDMMVTLRADHDGKVWP
jgi:hypothetical protein